MLIIFDLDDTLIDTSGSVTPFKLQTALKAMLERNPSEEEVRELLILDSQLARSGVALAQFAKEKGILEPFFSKGAFAMTSPLPSDFQVKCTPNAKEVLTELRLKAKLALVTVGISSFQLDKLKKAGIEEAFFSKIEVLKTSDKRSSYEGLTRLLNPSDVWVCGDRVDVDLKPARDLGFKTVHMRWGRGKSYRGQECVDYSIDRLEELREIIQ